MEKNHAYAEREPPSFQSSGTTIVTWFLYGALLLLCLGTAAALHIQFSRKPFRREGTATLLLLGLGAAGIGLGLAYRPF